MVAQTTPIIDQFAHLGGCCRQVECAGAANHPVPREIKSQNIEMLAQPLRKLRHAVVTHGLAESMSQNDQAFPPLTQMSCDDASLIG